MSPTELGEWVKLLGTFIKDVGFPVFVATYLLVRIDPTIRKLTAAIESLSAAANLAGDIARRGGR